MASVFRSSADRVWTADRLALSAEGNAEGFDSETMVSGTVSEDMLAYQSPENFHPKAQLNHSPLFRAPQTMQCRVAFASPVDSRSRLPQSVQKIKEPMTDMLAVKYRMQRARQQKYI